MRFLQLCLSLKTRFCGNSRSNNTWGIQGLTEFLPVSSSGHLEIIKYIFGNDKIGEESLTMTVVLHFATALSTLFIFRKDINTIFKKALKKEKEEIDFIIFIISSMIPAIIVGFVFESRIEKLFELDSLVFIGFMLIVTGNSTS